MEPLLTSPQKRLTKTNKVSWVGAAPVQVNCLGLPCNPGSSRSWGLRRTPSASWATAAVRPAPHGSRLSTHAGRCDIWNSKCSERRFVCLWVCLLSLQAGESFSICPAKALEQKSQCQETTCMFFSSIFPLYFIFFHLTHQRDNVTQPRCFVNFHCAINKVLLLRWICHWSSAYLVYNLKKMLNLCWKQGSGAMHCVMSQRDMFVLGPFL